MPQAAPMMALSLMGVSITRSQPKRSSKPSLVLNAPPYTPTSSPMTTTAGSRSISSNMACLMASRKVTGPPLPLPPAALLLGLPLAITYLRLLCCVDEAPQPHERWQLSLTSCRRS